MEQVNHPEAFMVIKVFPEDIPVRRPDEIHVGGLTEKVVDFFQIILSEVLKNLFKTAFYFSQEDGIGMKHGFFGMKHG
jgi:hypothetical protein